jgi:16S rRNA (cytosine967-C5)-methyltransferase
MSARAPAASPARLCAFTVLERVFEDGAYADRALHAAAEGLDARERAFATALAYTAIQRRATLDHLISRLASRDPDALDAPVREALRLGLTQLLLLGGVAAHAAVHESVELAKARSPRGAGLVNAVLRRAVREGPELLAGLGDDTHEEAAIRHSVPPWLARMWFDELGAERARALLAAVNRPAESAVRVNTLRASVAEVRDALGVPARPAEGIPEGLVLEAPFDVFGSDLWRQGAIMPQSRASMGVGRALAPAPGERVLDLCAAPGAKTTHLAALMGGEGEIVAIERHPGRAQALRRTLERMGAHRATVLCGDAADPPSATDGPRRRFHRVLVDPPCSGLGTLQSRPDLRWRASPARIAEAAELQARILRAAADATVPGGTIVYSVCTISRAECDDVIADLLAQRPDLALDGPPIRTAPDRDGTDGFFVARLTRG